MCLDLEGVSTGVYAVSDSCDTCNKVITLTKLNLLPLPWNYICVGVSSHFVLQYNKEWCRKCRHHLGSNDFQNAFFTLFCLKMCNNHEGDCLRALIYIQKAMLVSPINLKLFLFLKLWRLCMVVMRIILSSYVAFQNTFLNQVVSWDLLITK